MSRTKLIILFIILVVILSLLETAEARKKRLCRLRKRRGSVVCVDRRVKKSVLMDPFRRGKRNSKGKRIKLCSSTGKTCQLKKRRRGKRFACRCVEKRMDF